MSSHPAPLHTIGVNQRGLGETLGSPPAPPSRPLLSALEEKSCRASQVGAAQALDLCSLLHEVLMEQGPEGQSER